MIYNVNEIILIVVYIVNSPELCCSVKQICFPTDSYATTTIHVHSTDSLFAYFTGNAELYTHHTIIIYH